MPSDSAKAMSCVPRLPDCDKSPIDPAFGQQGDPMQ